MKDFEIWEDVEDYEGLYQVSNQGRIRSLYYGKIKEIRPWKNGRGYLLVDLSKNGKVKKYLVHRLVGNAFIENPLNLPEINHIDEDKTNNVVDNLEYCDSRYNNNYGTRTERMVEKRKKPVSQFNLNGELVKKWNSATDASRDLGFSQSAICEAAKNKYCGNSNFYKGYYWSY